MKKFRDSSVVQFVPAVLIAALLVTGCVAANTPPTTTQGPTTIRQSPTPPTVSPTKTAAPLTANWRMIGVGQCDGMSDDRNRVFYSSSKPSISIKGETAMVEITDQEYWISDLKFSVFNLAALDDSREVIYRVVIWRQGPLILVLMDCDLKLEGRTFKLIK